MGQSPDSSSYNADCEGLPFYQGNADFGETHPTPRIWCSEPKKVAEAGDILISVRAPVGAINVADERCCIGRGLAAVRPSGSDISNAFLALILQSKRAYLDSMSTGSTFKAIGKKVLSSCEVPLYSHEVQSRIACQINGIDDCLRSSRKLLSTLDDLVKSQFVEMFGDPIEQPKYQTESLGEACTKIGSGATPRGGKTIYMDNGTPFIRSLNVHNGTFIRKNLAYIGEEEAKKLSNVSLKRGDVLLNITGASVARSCVLPDDLVGGRVNQHVAILRANQSVILPCILNATLTSESYQRFMLEGAQKAGATREAITKQDLERFRVSIPPLSLQQQFADFVAKVDKLGFGKTYQEP